MAIDHILIKTHEDHNVHFDFKRDNTTLCGLYTLEDPSLGIMEDVITKKKVNCQQCIAIVKFCQQIKINEFKNQ